MKALSFRTVVAALILTLAAALVPARAHAITLNAFGGKYFAANEQLAWSGEVTFSLLPMLELGGFYEHSGESPSSHAVSGDETRSFYGAVGRFTLPIVNFFGDIRIGPHNISFSDGASSDNGFTTQLGVGYAFSLVPGLALLPRVGVQLADSNSTYPTWSGSIGLSLSLL